MITTEGERAIMNYLAGGVSHWAATVRLGVGDNEPADDDDGLSYPVAQAPVTVIAVDKSSNSLVVRSTFAPDTSYVVHEVGLMSSLTAFNRRRLVQFDSSVETFTGGDDNFDDVRLGSQGVEFTAPGEVEYTGLNQSLTDFGQRSKFALALQNRNLGGSNMAVRVDIGQSINDRYTYVKTVQDSDDYEVVTWRKADFQTIGSPTWSDITYLRVDLTGDVDCVLDGLFVRGPDNDAGNVLVVRNVLATPVRRLSGQRLDTEFRVALGIG